jgi:tetratricopeptide (TPR) repeat protein
MMLAQILFSQGKKDLALRAADQALKIDNNNEVLFSAGLLYLDAGHVDKARAAAGELGKKIEPEPLVYARLIGGQIGMARGDINSAIKIFQEAQEVLDSWLGRFLLGRAYLEAGAYTQAYSEFELCLKRQGEAISVFLNDLPTYRYFPPVYYYLGRAQQGLGSEAAAESYQKFLAIKAKADTDQAMIEDTRQHLSKR